ncbi:MAG: 6-phosphogluconolactonase [Chlamydiia bacterium]|nr:6-phosphogluconolactonase [Chlamydiia bacterium]
MIRSYDDRRDFVVLPTADAAISFAKDHFFHTAARSIQQKGRFAVALSGGSTPKALYQLIGKCWQEAKIDWNLVYLFWSDERAVPPTHLDSNYHMAMTNGLEKLPIPKGQIFRMKAESDLEKNAREYEETIDHFLGKSLFDLVMLGIGEDGHTASLFPNTAALEVTDRLVVANHILQKKTWRMTLTFPCIQQSSHTVIYALGSSKKEIIPQVLKAPILSPFPASRIGTPEHKALFVFDQSAICDSFQSRLSAKF